jgi:hypothetical protein
MKPASAWQPYVAQLLLQSLMDRRVKPRNDGGKIVARRAPNAQSLARSTSNDLASVRSAGATVDGRRAALTAGKSRGRPGPKSDILPS